MPDSTHANRSGKSVMKRRFARVRTLFVLLLLAGWPIAHADFYQALTDYKAGKFNEAAAEFSWLAELGDGPSQHNLGVMFVRGEGRPKDAGVGVGFMMAAAENGYGQLPPAKLAEFRAKLTPEQEAAAQKIVAQYGAKAMQENVLPAGTCRAFRPARTNQFASPIYPGMARSQRLEGFSAVAFTVGLDGIPRDPQVLVSMPEGVFDGATIDAILRTRFQPGERDGVPIEMRMAARVVYGVPPGSLMWNLSSLKKEREAADKGNPYAKHLIGLLGAIDPMLNIPLEKAQGMILSAAQLGVPRAQYWIAHQTSMERACNNNIKSQRWLEHSAKGGDPDAIVEWARLKSMRPVNDADAEELSKLLQTVVSKDNLYALKHAAMIFAASTNDKIANKETARQAALNLEKFEETLDPQVNEVVAFVAASTGDFAKAVKQQEQAIKKAKRLHWNTQNMDARLVEYKQGRMNASDVFTLPPENGAPSTGR